MILGKWSIQEADIEGWKLLVPWSYLKASKKEIEEKTGGCGPGGIGDWFVPDTMYGESVFLACQIHDWMYGEGETEEDRFYADMVFGWNMRVLILMSPETGEMEGESLDKFRLLRESKYFMAVRFGGEKAFADGKTMTAQLRGLTMVIKLPQGTLWKLFCPKCFWIKKQRLLVVPGIMRCPECGETLELIEL